MGVVNAVIPKWHENSCDSVLITQDPRKKLEQLSHGQAPRASEPDITQSESTDAVL